MAFTGNFCVVLSLIAVAIPVFCVAVLATTTPSAEASPSTDLITFLKSADYDQNQRPVSQDEGPARVNLSAKINSGFIPEPMVIRFVTLDMDLSQRWTDDRLAAFAPSTASGLTFSGQSPVLDLVWRPDIYINASRDKLQDREERVLRLHPGGELELWQRIVFMIPCNPRRLYQLVSVPGRMEYKRVYYECDIHLSSCKSFSCLMIDWLIDWYINWSTDGFTAQDIALDWDTTYNPVDMLKLQITEIGAQSSSTRYVIQYSTIGSVSRDEYVSARGGNFSRAVIKLQLFE